MKRRTAVLVGVVVVAAVVAAGGVYAWHRLATGGKVTEVPVTTGLSEGSFIEVTEGLKGDEVVIVEVDTPNP